MGKNKKLNLGILSLLLISIGGGVLSTAETIDDAKRQIDENNKIIGSEEGTTYTGESNGSFVTTKDGTKLEGKVKFDIKDINANEAHLELKGKGVKGDDLSITIAPKEGVTHTRSKGLITRGDSDVNVNNLNVDITFKDTTGQFSGSADSNASYGVAVGYNYNGGNKTDTSKLTVNNMDVKVRNTEDTTFNVKTVSKSFWGITITAHVRFGYQLSGLKVYRTNGAKAEFVSNGNTNILVEDVSKTKSGDYLAGVYVSGEESKATFNGDTNITVIGEGVNSAAIKIGKPVEKFDENKASKVEVNGKLNIDTTKMPNSGAVRLFTNNTSFEVTGKNTTEASLIKAGNSAIVFDMQDYVLGFSTKSKVDYNKSEDWGLVTTRNSNAENQSVKLHNTKLSTVSNDKSLILAKAEIAKDNSFGQASNFESSLNGGKGYASKNAVFELSGEKSEAIAANNGWLIETQGVDKNTVSSLTATIKDKASIYGMVNKAFGRGFDARLDMNLESGSKWVLKNKGDVNESTFNNLNIRENSILDASQFNLNAGDYSNVPIPKNLTENFENAKKKIERLKRYNLPPTPENLETMRQAEEAKEKAEEAIKEYKKNNQDPKAVASSRSEFVLNSSSLDDKSKITNSGTITLDNGKYHDKLTLKGKYSSTSGKLLVNTLWNEESGRNGENSESDLLEITGKVEGSTKVISVGSNN
ncbi:hypothetical protein, partial [Pseudostreptobacillus hongkongensis]|uniref:hypothetical protein n=3 Tax=Pseudostreptobacillus hongkongensis TaxID=1162717 RepID=UPI0039ED13B1